jgi:glycolate oxidase iron-sulfur subunit
MRAVSDGELSIEDPAFADAMYYCVGCRACETACPAGVEFGHLLEDARNALEVARPPNLPRNAPRRFLLDRLLPHPRRLRFAARLLRLHQRNLDRRRWWRRVVGKWPELEALEPLAPPVPPQNRKWRLAATVDPANVMTNGYAPHERGVVALHPGCVQQVLLPIVNADAAQVMAYNAWRVLIPRSFRCCGALHAHHGRLRQAKELARINIAAWESSGAERLVSNAAGCGAFFEEYGDLLADDPEWAERAEALSSAVVDVTEHLVLEGIREPKRPFGLRVTYDDPCHLVHGQRVAEAPRRLLRAIPGLDIAPLGESTWCCGSAGIYNLTHPESAGALLDRKIDRIRATGAELVVTGNPGCILQIEAGLRAIGSPIRVLHPVSLLRAASHGRSKRSTPSGTSKRRDYSSAER